MKNSIGKTLLKIFGLSILAVVLLAFVAILALLFYRPKSTLMEEVSPDGQCMIRVRNTEPWLYSPVNAFVYSGHPSDLWLSQVGEWQLNNDGKLLDENNYHVAWHEGGAVLTLMAEEQPDLTINIDCR